MEDRANWYKELQEIHSKENIIGIAYNDMLYNSVEEIKQHLDYEFDFGYGGTEGPPFTAWTAERVYFPTSYDGSEWITSVPRNPCNEVIDHTS